MSKEEDEAVKFRSREEFPESKGTSFGGKAVDKKGMTINYFEICGASRASLPLCLCQSHSASYAV